MELSKLLARIRSGDREAAAELGIRYSPEIRRRVRGQMGPELRRLFDSEDIFATVLRRLDTFVKDSPVTASSEREVRALLLRICNRAVVDKMKIVRRLRRVEGEDTVFASMMLERIDAGELPGDEDDDARIANVFQRLSSSEDRTILWLWLAGQDHATIAATLDKNPGAVRKRWQRIREALRDSIRQEDRL